MTKPQRTSNSGSRRRDRLIREREHDIYRFRSKLPEPAACPDCGAGYQNGRWQWIAPSPEAYQTLCPACRRIRDRCPAGYLTLNGSFLPQHEAEILHLAHNVEAREKTQHPMKRIMTVEKQAEGFLITTTEMDMARAIGEAIHHAYSGELHYKYADETNILYVHWSR